MVLATGSNKSRGGRIRTAARNFDVTWKYGKGKKRQAGAANDYRQLGAVFSPKQGWERPKRFPR
jgi:hypothetical protein